MYFFTMEYCSISIMRLVFHHSQVILPISPLWTRKTRVRKPKGFTEGWEVRLTKLNLQELFHWKASLFGLHQLDFPREAGLGLQHPHDGPATKE